MVLFQCYSVIFQFSFWGSAKCPSKIKSVMYFFACGDFWSLTGYKTHPYTVSFSLFWSALSHSHEQLRINLNMHLHIISHATIIAIHSEARFGYGYLKHLSVKSNKSV